MKVVYLMLLALTALLSGCTTPQQVQEMIDAADRSSQEKVAETDAKTDALNERVVEKGSTLFMRMEDVESQVNAIKILAAANVVSIGRLERTVDENHKLVSANQTEIEQLLETDQRYRELLIAHFKAVSETAQNALRMLESGAVEDVIVVPASTEEAALEESEAIPAEELAEEFPVEEPAKAVVPAEEETVPEEAVEAEALAKDEEVVAEDTVGEEDVAEELAEPVVLAPVNVDGSALSTNSVPSE